MSPDLPRGSSVLSCISTALSIFGGFSVSPGVFQFDRFRWDTGTPFEFSSTYAHNFRTTWRMFKFDEWKRSDRNGTELARSCDVRLTVQTLDQMRTQAAALDGHCNQVLCGGIWTEAHANVIPQTCSLCRENVVPSTSHILWHCSQFEALRQVAQPRNPFVARCAWGP